MDRELIARVVLAATLATACVTGSEADESLLARAVDPASAVDEALCDVVGAAPARRLSRSEYLATVRDLFPSLDLSSLTIGSDPTEHGFENRAELLVPRPMLIEQYNTAAADIAAAAIDDPSAIVPCEPTLEAEAMCGAKFVETFGRRIFRRPLSAEELDTYTGFLNAERAAGTGLEGAVQLTLEAMLQAPQFLYRIELGEGPVEHGAVSLTRFEVATRMSYLLWGSTPDDELLARAEANELATAEQRELEARRMLADPRAARMLVEFHRQWLDFDELANEPKDRARYPEYSADLATAIREESDRFVSRVMWRGDGTIRSLLTSREAEVNPLLAELYGVAAPESGWAPVTLDPTERAGFLTRANFLASRGHALEGSPPLRGIFVLDRLLCGSAGGPPADADLSEPAATAEGERTNRQLFEERLAAPACAGCHAIFTPLGYAFEGYDAIGRHRTTDHDAPVDASGRFAQGEIDWNFTNAIELSERLAESPEVMRCAADRWYAYASGNAIDAATRCRARAFGDALVEAGGDVREMLVRYVTSDEFALRPAVMR
jgi:hypothetical protein